ncbi:unnamed protein product [Arctia plantaginis]|uniref:Uncharacterized protein n=1 Tax=Arctia plantaginis TaxID=874455 RepID=A0A8S0ZAA6_ARCPL|nr:unnamed protein product [Arctia plantaginis]
MLDIKVPTPRGSVSSTSSTSTGSRLARLLTQGVRGTPEDAAIDTPRRLSWERSGNLRKHKNKLTSVAKFSNLQSEEDRAELRGRLSAHIGKVRGDTKDTDCAVPSFDGAGA